MKEIDVWHASLDRPVDEIRSLYGLLNEGERARAEKFQRVVDRDRFIAARGTLRTLLGEYTETSPAEVSIVQRSGGKPSLEHRSNRDGIHFNISHCGGLGLFAFWDHEIGIDAQKIEESADMSRVVSHFFSPDERIAFGQLPAEQRTAFFFRVWVRKEAYLKATGEGLSVDPSTIQVAGKHALRASSATADHTFDADTNYVLHDIVDVPGYAAAVARLATSREPEISLNEWTRPAPSSRATPESASSR